MKTEKRIVIVEGCAAEGAYNVDGTLNDTQCHESARLWRHPCRLNIDLDQDGTGWAWLYSKYTEKPEGFVLIDWNGTVRGWEIVDHLQHLQQGE